MEIIPPKTQVSSAICNSSVIHAAVEFPHHRKIMAGSLIVAPEYRFHDRTLEETIDPIVQRPGVNGATLASRFKRRIDLRIAVGSARSNIGHQNAVAYHLLQQQGAKCSRRLAGGVLADEIRAAGIPESFEVVGDTVFARNG